MSAAALTVSAPAPIAARVALAAVGVALGSLASLHVLSPELDPSWRVVSEYAHGDFAGVLALMFVAWGVSSWALAMALRPHVGGGLGRVGLGALIVAGLGQAAAALFPIDHPLHELAAVLGGLGLPTAAMLLSIRLGRDAAWAGARRSLLVAANLTWASELVMIGSLVLMVTTYTAAGGDPDADPTTITSLPAGTIAFVGWANRLLVVAYFAWTATAAVHVLRR